MPIGIAQSFGTPPTCDIALWLIGLFALSIGLPFAALSASAPLLQGWFAASGHPQAGNPYVLYAASNLGSFAALIAYPIVIEPMLSLHDQSRLWSVGFAGLAVLIAAASLFVADRPGLERGGHAAARATDARPPGMDGARRDPGRARHRGDLVHHHRRGGGAVPLGGAARALSPDLRGRIPRAAVDFACDGCALLPIVVAPLSIGLLGAATSGSGWR